MNEHFGRIQARIRGLVDGSTNPSSSLYKDATKLQDEVTRLDNLIKRFAPSLEKSWKNLLQDVNNCIEIDKRRRSLSKENTFQALEQIENEEVGNSSLKASIVKLKNAWKTLNLQNGLSEEDPKMEKLVRYLAMPFWNEFQSALEQEISKNKIPNTLHQIEIVCRDFLSSLKGCFNELFRSAVNALNLEASSESLNTNLAALEREIEENDVLRAIQASLETHREQMNEALSDTVSAIPEGLKYIIASFAYDLLQGCYGEEIKEAFESSDPAVICPFTFLKFLIIQCSRDSKWRFDALKAFSLPSEINEKLMEFIEGCQKDPLEPEEIRRIVLASPLSEKEKRVSESLKEIVLSIRQERIEETAQVQWMSKQMEVLKKSKNRCREVLNQIRGLKSPISRSKCLVEHIKKIESSDFEELQVALEFALEEIECIEDVQEAFKCKKEIGKALFENLKKNPYKDCFVRPATICFFEEELIFESNPEEKGILGLAFASILYKSNPQRAKKYLEDSIAFVDTVPLELFMFLLDFEPRDLNVDKITLLAAQKTPIENRVECLCTFIQKKKSVRPKLVQRAELTVIEEIKKQLRTYLSSSIDQMIDFEYDQLNPFYLLCQKLFNPLFKEEALCFLLEKEVAKLIQDLFMEVENITDQTRQKPWRVKILLIPLIFKFDADKGVQIIRDVLLEADKNKDIWSLRTLGTWIDSILSFPDGFILKYSIEKRTFTTLLQELSNLIRRCVPYASFEECILGLFELFNKYSKNGWSQICLDIEGYAIERIEQESTLLDIKSSKELTEYIDVLEKFRKETQITDKVILEEVARKLKKARDKQWKSASNSERIYIGFQRIETATIGKKAKLKLAKEILQEIFLLKDPKKGSSGIFMGKALILRSESR